MRVMFDPDHDPDPHIQPKYRRKKRITTVLVAIVGLAVVRVLSGLRDVAQV